MKASLIKMFAMCIDALVPGNEKAFSSSISFSFWILLEYMCVFVYVSRIKSIESLELIFCT